nr:MAG TPA_asm: hypothetical protein [Caudoviricetes sp.]
MNERRLWRDSDKRRLNTCRDNKRANRSLCDEIREGWKWH